MEERINEIISIVDNINLNTSNENYQIYQEFKRDYILFLNLIYEKLYQCEINNLNDGLYHLNTHFLEFGTDELEYDFQELSHFLLEVDRILGNNVNQEKYKNKLVDFKNMFYNFFKIIDCEINSDYGLDKFDELTKSCFDKIGFKTKSVKFMNTIIFKIDTCSRIEQVLLDFKKEEFEYIKQHPELVLPIITTDIDIYNYIKPRLENWNKNNIQVEDNKLLFKNKGGNL